MIHYRVKKVILLLLLILFSFGNYAQIDSGKRATKITKKMTKVLSLNKEEKTRVYDIQLNRFQQIASVREKYKNDSQTRKSELKKVYRKLFGILKNALGEDKMQSWKNYKQNL